jgi:hypothetical protein
LLLFGLPKLQHSKYRHRLWTVRDAIVDDIIDERLSLSKEAQDLLLRVHLSIKYAPDHTMRSALTSMLLLRGQQIPNVRKSLATAKLPVAERELLTAHYEAMRAATVWHLMHGSPSGWLLHAAARVVPLGLVGSARRVKASETADQELGALPKLYPEATGTLSRDLVLCA